MVAPPLPLAEWVSSSPLALAELAAEGRTVVLHFWTYSCPNCLRVLPVLARLWEQYRHLGLVVVGVHAPQFGFERDSARVRHALARHVVTWPTVLDADHQAWQRFGNVAWPRQLVIDPSGRIAYDAVGDRDTTALEATVQRLLHRHGASALPDIPPAHAHKLGTTCYATSVDSYLGSVRGALKNPPGAGGIPTEFSYAARSFEPGIALVGQWQLQPESVRHTRSCRLGSEYLSFMFSGTGVDVVGASSDGAPIEVVVSLDGAPLPPEQRGSDLVERNGQTLLRIAEPRAYQVVRPTAYRSPAELRLADDTGRLEVYACSVRGCLED